jgi:GNAT superfamily N-acetyltransferase
VSDLVFRPGDRRDDAELRRLNAEAFPANPKTRVEITAWQWWDNPFGETIVHVWEHEGRLVGQYVAYRMPALLDGSPGRVAIGVDYAIAPSHRGQGLGKPMLDACFGQATAEGTPFYSLPNQLSVGGATRSGLSIVAQLEVRVLPKVVARLPLLGRRARVPSGVDVSVVDDVPDDVDRLWSAVERHHPWGVARHGDWWRWRYAGHPDRPYRLVEARRGGHLVGLSAVVTRDDLGGRFHCLLELLAVDESAARAVVATVADRSFGPARGVACTAVPGSRLAHLAGAAGLRRIPPRVLPRPVYFGVVPCPGVVPDPAAVPWSTAWGDLDHI